MIGSHDPFASSGEMAALMRVKDWRSTPLGPVEGWPQSLRTIVRVLLTSRFAMWMGWGPELTFLYNDAYGAMTLGAKHPWALGRPSHEVWAEIWTEIGPRIQQVMQTGTATWDEDLLLFLERNGYPEETYHTFSYSPIAGDDGSISGMLCVVTEETNRVIGERRMALLCDTAAATALTEGEMFAALSKVLNGSKDLPFTLTYLIDEDRHARLVCRTGLPAYHPAAPTTIDLQTAANEIWPLGAAIANTATDTVATIPARFAYAADGPGSRPVTQALVLPLTQQGQRRTSGVVIAGLNPFRPLDDAYQAFVRLFVTQVSAGVVNIHAYQEERRRAQALAELDRAKTTFFSNVSHEFRTPLTLLLGPLEAAHRAHDRLPADLRDQLELARRNSLRLLKLVNTLLDFSRIEAGRIRVRFEPIDLAAYTADLASTFRSAVESAGLTYTVAGTAVDEPVYVDREMWEKIVLNLISNAFKFTLDGEITVSLARRDDRVLLIVRDTGLGIPESELPRIFERFHRVEGAQGRSHEGSGIGLALVHELVKLHGGTIEVESKEHRGTTFTVSLPMGSAHLPADHVAKPTLPEQATAAMPYVEEALRWLPEATTVAAAAASAAASSAIAGDEIARVLLADDNADMREYAARLLSERWRVDTVSNGRDALRRARAVRPDVIVTDVMMPGLDGFGLLRELRADPDLRAIPVIMLSARAGEEARLEGLAASADDYVVKPFSARDFLARVEVQLIKAQRRQLEQEHLDRLALLFANAPVAIAVMRGPDHVYELANARYREMVARRDVVGRSIREALPELAGQGIYELLDRVWTTGEPFVGQSLRLMLNRTTPATTEEGFFDFVYQPMFDRHGQIERIAVIAHDVTALATAKRTAESANRVKDDFLATLSHELRTPLNAVLGYTQMLRGGVIGADRFPNVLETIERNASLQEKLIADVLDISRIITGKMRIDIRPVDLSRVILEAIETVSPAAQAKNIRLQTAIDQPGVPVAGDAERLQQVMWNLLSNAIKFTGKNGRVQVRMQRVDSHVEVAVSDTGEGIDPDFLPNLFQRFTQADSGFTREHGGLGLGLAISRHLVEAHGGQIRAASPGKGQGTTISVQLPLMIVHDDRSLDAGRHPRLDLPRAVDLQLADLTGVRLLLVDDDADALQLAKDALTAAGATVTTATNATDALQALDGERFDAALLDVGMPGVNGYELLRQIRRRPKDAQGSLPIGALTAYARATDRARSLESGFQLHLSKPVQPNELAAAALALARTRN
jgi:signal transduction histidine kinase